MPKAKELLKDAFVGNIQGNITIDQIQRVESKLQSEPSLGPIIQRLIRMIKENKS
ncbi:MAG: hypothetical protein PF693_13965 [Spirochaetia bacterium]|nr:hypothetical protein [Spirochaetia bacterium]